MQNVDGCKFALMSGIVPCNPSQEQENLPPCMEDAATTSCLPPPTEFPPSVPPPPLEQASTGTTAIAEQPQLPVRRVVRRQQSSETALGIMASWGCPSEALTDTPAPPMDPLPSVRLARMRTDANIRMARRRQYSREHMLTQPPRRGADVRRTGSFSVTAPSLPAAAAQRPSFEDCDLLQLQQTWTFSNTSDTGSSSGNAVPNKTLHQSAPFIPRPSSRPPSDSSPVTDLDRLAYSMQLITRGRPLSEVMSDMKSIRQRWNFSN